MRGFFVSRQANNFIKKPIEYYLTENSCASSNSLKKRLIKEGYKENKCEICGITEWMGKPLILQLDHINGNHSDNRLNNLRILCPNCHSQTETWGNKGEKEINKCPDCGREILPHSKRCRSCAGKYRNLMYKVNRPSKEELYKLICSYSFVKIGTMYGVSDNSVRKWCKKYGLPYKIPDIKKSILENK